MSNLKLIFFNFTFSTHWISKMITLPKFDPVVKSMPNRYILNIFYLSTDFHLQKAKDAI